MDVEAERPDLSPRASSVISDSPTKGPEDDDIRAQLERISTSPPFVRAGRMQAFLRFVVNETLAGRGTRLKEYAIAVNVFGKPDTFDPATNPIVRVEAGRLRKVLSEYRVTHGMDDPIIIDVPRGSYSATFALADSSTDQRARLEAIKHGVKAGGTRRPSIDPQSSLTVLCCSFRGVESRHGSSASGEFSSWTDRQKARCADIVGSFGGVIDRDITDQVVAYFGWPAALEDTAGRALTAASAIMMEGRTLGQYDAIGIRIGVNTRLTQTLGALQLGDVQEKAGEDLRAEAIQMADAVPVNAVFVDEATRRQTGPSFAFIPAGMRSGRWRERGIQWRLLGPNETETRYRALHGGQQYSIVGRAEECALLLRRWSVARQGEGQCVVLYGEAGIGKSSLVESVLARIDDGGEIVRVQCSPHHGMTALHPFIRVFRNWVRAAVGEDREEERDCRAFLAALKLDVQPNPTRLRTFLSPADAADDEDTPAKRRKDDTLRLLSSIVLARAFNRPTILLVEDLHWADPTTVELLQSIVLGCTDLSLLIVVTSRTDMSSAFDPLTNIVSSIRLSRLPKRESNELIDRVLQSASLSLGARSSVLDRSEGVPLFLEELTKLFLGRDENVLEVPLLTHGLNDLLAVQLDRLGDARDIAQVAAVIGKTFSKELLAAAANRASNDVDEALDQLLSARIVLKQGLDDGHGYAFRHALLRDAAYASIPQEGLPQLHFKVGIQLIESFPEIASEQPETVARHMTLARRHDEALPFWVAAGRQAAGRYALMEAAEDFRSALEAISCLPGTDRIRLIKLEVLTDLGTVLRTIRAYGDPDLPSTYNEARHLAEELGKNEHLASIIYGQWTLCAGLGEWDAAKRHCAELDDLALHIDGDGQLAIESLRMKGAQAAFQGRLGVARECFDAALRQYDGQRHGPRLGYDPGAISAAYLTWVLWHIGARDEAARSEHRAFAIVAEKHHPPTEAVVLAWLIFYAVCDRQFDAVLQYNDRLQAICTEHDYRHWTPFGRACAEWARFQVDRDERHLPALVEAADKFGRSWGGFFTPCLLLLGADLCATLGYSERGLALIRSARQRIKQTGESLWASECDRLAAELALVQPGGDKAKIVRLLAQAARVAKSQGAKALLARINETRVRTTLPRNK